MHDPSPSERDRYIERAAERLSIGYYTRREQAEAALSEVLDENVQLRAKMLRQAAHFCEQRDEARALALELAKAVEAAVDASDIGIIAAQRWVLPWLSADNERRSDG
jgi:hypothetical protein